jgi:macrophage erythroblast attacher
VQLEEASQVEQTQVAQCRARVEHMGQLAALTASSSGSAGDGEEARAWHSKQLERMLVDHMLRSGYYDAAAQLADAAGLELLVDAHVFLDARRVTTALQAHDCAPALAWCATHAPRLKKLKVRPSLSGDAHTYTPQHLPRPSVHCTVARSSFPKAMAAVS